MSTSKSTIFLTFTTLALAITSGYLFKCYSAEKNEKVRQINENVQLQVRCVDAEQQRDDALVRIQQLNEEIRGLNTVGGIRDTTIQSLRTRIRQLESPLVPLRNITNRLLLLQQQLRDQNNRDIVSELSQLNQLDENRLLRETQNRDTAVEGLTFEIQNLRNEAINIVVGQIRTEAQAREYQRQHEILNEIVNELNNPDLQKLRQNVNNINGAFDNRMDELIEAINRLSGQNDNQSDEESDEEI